MAHSRRPPTRPAAVGVRRMAVAAALLALAAPAAAQWDADATALSRADGTPSLRLAGGTESMRLPRIDMALLAPQAPADADPVRIARLAQGAAFGGPLNLGLRWRPDPVAGFAFRASVWRRISQDGQVADNGAPEPVYGAQVEMELKRDARAELRDLLGMKMDNGGRISLKPRKNAVTVYYKMNF